MTLGDAWSKYLPTTHREALQTALDILVDEFLDQYSDIVAGDLKFSESMLGGVLPSKHSLRYTPVFAKRFFACLLTVAWKLAQPRPPEPLLCCTAEELALDRLIRQAQATLEMRNLDSDFNGFKDDVFQDLDYEILYDPAADGIEDTAAGDELDLQFLHFDDWFKPFDDATTVVHPYASN